MALELGADDYITKPFSPRELLARIRTVLRRYQTARKALPPHSEKVRAYRFDGWEVNVGTRRLKGPEGRSLEITRGEFSLLQAFCSAPRAFCHAISCSISLACWRRDFRSFDRRSNPSPSPQNRSGCRAAAVYQDRARRGLHLRRPRGSIALAAPHRFVGNNLVHAGNCAVTHARHSSDI